jgi:cystathionine beta-lyase
MNHEFDNQPDRRKSDSIKWTFFEEDVLPLWVADLDFASPAPVIESLRKRIDHKLFGYSLPQDSTIDAVCNWLKRRYDWQVSPDEVLLLPGVVPSFNIAARACTNPGDSVLIQTPAYRPFLELPENSQLLASEQTLSANNDGEYYIDLDIFSDKILPSTRIFMLCNPHNPTGRVFREEELTSLAEICLEREVIICADEIHNDIVYSPNRHIPIASLSEDISQITITLISPSKAFNLAGLKCSAVIITNSLLRDRFHKEARGLVGPTNLLGETAMHAAYNYCDNWLEDLLNYLDKNRQYLVEYVQTELPGVEIAKPEGTYLGWLDFSGTKLEDPAKFFQENARVALKAGEWFGCNFRSYARINFGCQFNILEMALNRIKSAMIST